MVYFSYTHIHGIPGGARLPNRGLGLEFDTVNGNPQIVDLEQLLDRISKAARENDQVSLRIIREELGNRTFGPLLLLAGLVTVAPVIGDIPGVPTVMAVFVFLIAGQLLIGRQHLWLPHWLLERSVTVGKVDKMLKWTRRPARFIDRLLRPRLPVLVHGAGSYAIAITCLIIASAMPPMELVPFTANGAGAALTAFGLALIARDGLLALLAFIFTGATLGAVVYGLV